MKAHLNNSFEGPVYSVDSSSTEDDKKLYELSVRMKQLATDIKVFAQDPKVSLVSGSADELADTVIEFLKVSGWSR